MTEQSDPGLRGARVLVTGASGFIGRHLVRRLLADGIVPDLMLRPGRAPVSAAESGPCRLHEAALDDAAGLRALMARVRPDIVFHLGGYTDPARDPSRSEAALATNLQGTVTLATAALETGVRAFVATGTSEEYGRQPAPFSEDLPLRPLSPYSASKAGATLWLRMLHDTHGLPAVTVRPFLVYGPGQPPPKLVPAAVLAALAGQDFPMTEGRQMRELTYVDDVVAGLLAAATVPAAQGGVFNLGSGDERPVVDIVRLIYALAGGTGQPRPGAIEARSNDMQRFCADTALSRRVLGWQATTPLEQGLRATIAWSRTQGDTPVPLDPAATA